MMHAVLAGGAFDGLAVEVAADCEAAWWQDDTGKTRELYAFTGRAEKDSGRWVFERVDPAGKAARKEAAR